VRQMALDGFYYYAYNEVAFFTLNQVAPITRACRPRLVAPSHTHCRPYRPHRARTCAGPHTLPRARHTKCPHTRPQTLLCTLIRDASCCERADSIANTFKRVAIILATVLVFGNKLTTLGAIGSSIAILVRW
jgi:hypothetical protein